MPEWLLAPWPWYVAGPLIGLTVPALLLFGRKVFGISSTFQHLCAAALPRRFPYLDYDWRAKRWQLALAAGMVIGGWIAMGPLTAAREYEIAISEATRADLTALGVTDFSGLVPRQWISWEGLGTLPGLVMIVAGGFLVGFGARWADGCTSGHAITGLANLQLPSLIATLGFFAGGLVAARVLLPLLLGSAP
ncbi:MAG: YeeE/YedE thiosulfate transporter family protein [Gemmatimonadota bacterium]|nr:YeeE/YedE thiosulfate transporter family protein [Gemmatimonadota bacterium]